MLLVPSDRKDFDSPACLPELVPKLPVGLAPAMERASGRHVRIYGGEDGPVLFDGGAGSWRIGQATWLAEAESRRLVLSVDLPRPQRRSVAFPPGLMDRERPHPTRIPTS